MPEFDNWYAETFLGGGAERAANSRANLDGSQTMSSELNRPTLVSADTYVSIVDYLLASTFNKSTQSIKPKAVSRYMTCEKLKMTYRPKLYLGVAFL